MNTPYSTFSYLSGVSGATTTRTSPTRWSDVVNVKDFGAVGDGVTNDTAAIQAAFNSAYGSAGSPHGISFTLNKPVFFPSGNYLVTGNPALTLTNVQGAHIFGAGRFTTTITHGTAGAVLLETDGFEYSVIERIYLFGSSGAGSRGLNLNHHTSGFLSVQSNSIEDVSISGFEIGINLAATVDGGGSFGQGSEIYVKDCYINNCSAAGIVMQNANALQLTVIGGNIASCGTGVHVNSGSANCIIGVGLQANTGYDIQIESQSQNTMAVIGCRSESTNFLNNLGGQKIYMAGVHHSGIGINGTFYFGQGGSFEIVDCLSYSGQVSLSFSANGSIRDSEFDRSDWFATSNLWSNAGPNGSIAQISIENIQSIIPSTGRQRVYVSDAGPTITRTLDVGAAALTDHTAVYSGGASVVTFNAPSTVYYTVTIQANATTNNTTAAGSAVLNFASTPGWNGSTSPIVNQTVVDATNSGVILPGTKVVSVTATTATLSATVGGAGVGNGDNILFIIPQTHGLAAGQPVAFTGGTLPGVVAGSNFYVISAGLTSTSFQVSGTLGGSAITFSGTQVPNNFVNGVRTYAIGDMITNNAVVAGGSPGWVCTTAGQLAIAGIGGSAVFKAMANVAA